MATAAESLAAALAAAREAAVLKMPLWQHGLFAAGTVAAVVGATVLLSRFLHAQADKALANQVLAVERSIAFYLAHASAWDLPERARCFKTRLVVAPRPSANFQAEAGPE